MKRSSVVVVAFLGGLSALAAGCGATGVTTTPAASATPARTSSGATSQPTPSDTGAQKAGVGDTIDLSDSATGVKIAVTVVKVVDQDSSNNEFETPSAGGRFESVQVRIVNSGAKDYQDDPLMETTAKDAAGQNLQQAIVDSTTAGAQMPSSMSLAPGDAALGYVTFDVPDGDKIAQVQYSLNLALTATTGEWQIGNSQTQPSAAPPSTSASSAQSVVEQYFAAINAGNYALAWSLGGKNIQQGSYDSFVQGFADTSSDSITVVSVSGDTVAVTLDATQTDGSHKYFAGTYTVKNGAIVAADIH